MRMGPMVRDDGAHVPILRWCAGRDAATKAARLDTVPPTGATRHCGSNASAVRRVAFRSELQVAKWWQAKQRAFRGFADFAPI